MTGRAHARVVAATGLVLAAVVALPTSGSYAGTAMLPASAVSTSLPAAAAPAPPSFVMSGSGWGHGVGLSQYGARAQAAAGRTAAQILAHYYTGTTLATMDDSADLRVQILRSPKPTATTTNGLMRIRIGSSVLRDVPSGATVTFVPVGNEVAAQIGGVTISGAQAAALVVEWEGTRFYRPGGPVAITDVPGAGGRYRHGRLEMRVLDGQVNVVNVVRLHDEYLHGIAEVPSSWPNAALDAQAVIARGFALVNQQAALKADCSCHVYDEVRSQKFTGWVKENEIIGGTDYGARWRAAVARTAVGSSQGQVVVDGGALVPTFYFSSSGGATQNSEDVWTAALPHLRSVPDPWSLDPANNPTYAAWTRNLSQAQVAQAFGLPDVAALDLSARTTARGVLTARATSSGGATATISGEQLRTRLGLPSTWVRRAEVRLAGADRWATSVAVARQAFPTGRTVVIVSGNDANLVDGLVAGPLARSLQAPVLLTGKDSLPSAVRAELVRRGANRALLVGGDGVVSAQVERQLSDLGIGVERVAGADRYATAAAVARRMGAPRTTAVVASGEAGSLVDALAASGPAAATGRPILLVSRDDVPPVTAKALRDLGVTGSTCVGGTGVLSERVRTALPACFRAGGDNRFDTAVAVARAFRSLVPSNEVAVVSGSNENLVDALGAGTLGHLVLLAPRGELTAGTKAWLQQTPTIARLKVVGGTGAVTPSAVMRMREA